MLGNARESCVVETGDDRRTQEISGDTRNYKEIA